MKFNQYIWKLYKNSPQGKEYIESCKPVKEFLNDEDYLIEVEPEFLANIKESGFDEAIKNGRVNLQNIYYHYFLEKPFAIEHANESYARWLEEGIVLRDIQFVPKQSYDLWMSNIDLISNALFAAFPEFFFPFFFQHNFDRFQLICNEYEISLPEIPNKRKKMERALYYLKICKTLYEFRKLNKLLPEELNAFFYDFAPNTVFCGESEDKLLPEPSKVWYVGGGDYELLDNASKDENYPWQCHLDTRPGDIVIMYCWSPRSYIHSVWRATTYGFIDPFFYYHRLAYISQPIKVPPIKFKEIKENPILSQSPIVGNSFQGVNGYPITYGEYEEMLRLWQVKGMDTSPLPKIEQIIGLPEEVWIGDERDVEIHLVEPLLKRLQYSENDWIRQMPVKMGRGYRYYPDYCFGAVAKRGDEKAEMILEAKYSIKNTKALQDAYLQAKSYAIRLQAQKFIIAAKEGIWVYLLIKKDYKFEDYRYYSWNELTDPDKFHELLKITKR